MIRQADGAGWLTLSAGDLRLALAPEVGGSVAAFGVERAQGYTPLFRRAPEASTMRSTPAAFRLSPFQPRPRRPLRLRRATRCG